MAYDARTRGYYSFGELADHTTAANVYTDVGTWQTGNFGTKRMLFTAADANVNVRILGSFDGGVTYPITAVAEFLVAVGTPVIQTITDLYTNIKVQVDPAADGVHGTLSTQYTGWSR